MVFCASPLIRGNKRNTEQWASNGQRMDCLSRQNSSLIGPKNPPKFEIDCISRNVHRFKITQPNLTILVSFSSAEDVLSNVFKKWNFWPAKYWKSAVPLFLGHPVYGSRSTCTHTLEAFLGAAALPPPPLVYIRAPGGYWGRIPDLTWGGELLEGRLKLRLTWKWEFVHYRKTRGNSWNYGRAQRAVKYSVEVHLGFTKSQNQIDKVETKHKYQWLLE